MAIERADILHLDNGTTVDTAAGIDIRRLNATAVAADTTQSARWTHTQDGTNRTFDPANALVTVVADPQTFQGEGWALRLADDMTPADDTNCNASLLAGTVAVILDPNLNASGGTNLGGVNTINFRCSLWRYNPTTDTAVSIANGNANQTWDTSTLGAQNNTYRAVTVNITVASAVEFAQGEILLLQVGANATTLVDATLGTTNYDLTLRIGTATASRIDFAASQGIRQVCVLTLNTVGEGVSTRGGLAITQPRSAVGEGTPTFTRVALIAKAFDLIGEGVVTRQFSVSEFFDLIGDGVPTMSRVVVAAKSFTLLGEGVATSNMAIALARSAVGEGTPTFSKLVVASKTFSLIGEAVATRQFAVAEDFDVIGEGVPTMTRVVVAAKSFNLIGEGVATRVLAVALTLSAVGEGTPTFSKAVIASKSFDVVGDGLLTFVKFTTVYRYFDLIGDGKIEISGNNASTVTLPIDEIPSGGGGDIIIIKKPTYVFDD